MRRLIVSVKQAGAVIVEQRQEFHYEEEEENENIGKTEER
jgi:hypothetical protein